MGANATLAWLAGKRTPAIDAVARAGIAFTVHEYEHDPRAPSFGLEAVEKLGLDPARVYKTLVADVDGSLTVAVVPVEAQLDLRALGKRVRMADQGPQSGRRATSPAVSARSATDAACRRSSTSRRSRSRQST
jgi:Cys-tRNA(Pro)/Cys-tRNA(Cys) deacylase